MTDRPLLDRDSVHEELERARAEFHGLLDAADEDALGRPTCGTRWNNEQLLFHMLFGYMIVRALLVLVRVFGRLPRGAGRAYARLLDATTKPFDVINYLGPCAAVHVYGHRRMGAKFDRVISALHRSLDAETEADLARGMHFPVKSAC
ncbi:DinB family protein [Kitasatospora sp. NPDC058046]|uniref:DinB family protein n=1 Tax=Kitasatospora sp. NPDC058046 TaxID=3346312 RepID=UPI0036D9F6A3